MLCGDATNADAVARLLGERKPRLMVTDPPYGIELDSEWRDRAGLNGEKRLRINGRGEWIRTTGLLVPNQALYQAEPRPE